MNKPLTHADIGRLWDEVGGPKLTSEQWSAMHRFCPRLLKEAAPPPQAAPKAERGVQEPFAHICIVNTKDAGPTKFFTAPSDPRGFPVYLSAPAERVAQWRPIETAPHGVMLLFADMKAMEARHWIFCGWRHSALLKNAVQMPDNTARHATHWMPLPDAPGGIGGTEGG